ncbi:hypothetical protein ADK74_28445 [Streptomyces decoyicus]|nr:hypothetical protein ADK74_28445 [Streptomyces decoyicus]
MSSLELTFPVDRQASTVLVDGIEDAHLRVGEVSVQLGVIPTVAPGHPTDKAADHGTPATRQDGIPDSRALTGPRTQSVGSPVLDALQLAGFFNVRDRLLDVRQMLADLVKDVAGVVRVGSKFREVVADLLRRSRELFRGVSVPGLQNLGHGIIEFLLDAVIPVLGVPAVTAAHQLDANKLPALGDIADFARVGALDHLLDLVQPQLGELRAALANFVALLLRRTRT